MESDGSTDINGHKKAVSIGWTNANYCNKSSWKGQQLNNPAAAMPVQSSAEQRSTQSILIIWPSWRDLNKQSDLFHKTRVREIVVGQQKSRLHQKRERRQRDNSTNPRQALVKSASPLVSWGRAIRACLLDNRPLPAQIFTQKQMNKWYGDTTRHMYIIYTHTIFTDKMEISSGIEYLSLH